MSENVFGRIFTAAEVELAVRSTLQMWVGTYLREVERQLGITAHTLPAIRSYDTLPEFESWEENQLPAAIIVSPGLAAEPERMADGQYLSRWQVAIACVVSTSGKLSTNDTARMYAAAIRAVIIQKRSLGGVADGTDWIDESYDDAPNDAERGLAVAYLEFHVIVNDVVRRIGGPFIPSDDPDDLPLVQQPFISIERRVLAHDEEI